MSACLGQARHVTLTRKGRDGRHDLGSVHQGEPSTGLETHGSEAPRRQGLPLRPCACLLKNASPCLSGRGRGAPWGQVSARPHGPLSRQPRTHLCRAGRSGRRSLTELIPEYRARGRWRGRDRSPDDLLGKGVSHSRGVAHEDVFLKDQGLFPSGWPPRTAPEARWSRRTRPSPPSPTSPRARGERDTRFLADSESAARAPTAPRLRGAFDGEIAFGRAAPYPFHCSQPCLHDFSSRSAASRATARASTASGRAVSLAARPTGREC